METNMMVCTKCKQQFKDGQKVQYTGLSVYHEVLRPRGDDFQYAVERPFAVISIKHLVCHEDE